MNETRRIALEFALRFKPKTNLDVIRVAMLFEAYLSNEGALISQAVNTKSDEEQAAMAESIIAPFASMFEGTK